MNKLVKSSQVECITITNLNEWKDWVKVILEPNDSYSPAGGRISIVSEYLSGTHFFSHAGDGTFKEFIGQCDSPYLIGKLFSNFTHQILINSPSELIKWTSNCQRLEYVKNARFDNVVSKEELRSCYEYLKSSDSYETFSAMVEEFVLTKESKTLDKIFGDNFLIEFLPSLPNPEYLKMIGIVKAVIDAIKAQVSDA